MERETLSNNTEYQKRLKEARIKGVTKEELLDNVQQLQQQVHLTIGYFQVCTQ